MCPARYPTRYRPKSEQHGLDKPGPVLTRRQKGRSGFARGLVAQISPCRGPHLPRHDICCTSLGGTTTLLEDIGDNSDARMDLAEPDPYSSAQWPSCPVGARGRLHRPPGIHAGPSARSSHRPSRTGGSVGESASLNVPSLYVLVGREQAQREPANRRSTASGIRPGWTPDPSPRDIGE